MSYAGDVVTKTDQCIIASFEHATHYMNRYHMTSVKIIDSDNGKTPYIEVCFLNGTKWQWDHDEKRGVKVVTIDDVTVTSNEDMCSKLAALIGSV